MRDPLLRSLSLSMLLAVCPAAAAGILYVDGNLTTGLNDGSSWDNAYQGAIGMKVAQVAAVAGDKIFVAQGTYLPSDTGAQTFAFSLANDVEIYGSFLGTEATPEERPPFGTAPSVLTGDLAGDDGLGMFADNSFHVVRTAGTDASAVLDGFVITAGAATGVGGNQDRGGGILCVGGVSPTVRNCRFVGNRATFGGGAGYINNGSAPSFTDCSFEDGLGGSFGGAFDIAGGGPVLFERCLFAGNTAARAGALEIFSTNGVVVDNCVFRDNTATGGSGGGAIWMGSGGNTRVRNCTIVDNSATAQAAGGLRNQGATGATVVNCVFWDNSGPGGAQGADNQITAGTLVTYSIVEGGFAGTGNLAVDPALVDIGGGDVSPTPASPGIDAGNNAEVQAGTTLDYALQPRLADVLGVADTGAGSAPVVDMGAVEFPSVWVDLGNGLAGVSGSPSLVGDGTLLDGSPGALSLSQAAPAAPCILFVSLFGASAPFKCGILVPVPVNLQLPLVTDGAGSIPLAWANWPTGLSGLSVYLQYAVQDAAAICGAALSNAVRGDVP